MAKRTMLHVALVIAFALLALLLIRLHAAAAQGLDPHRIYEDRCAACHQPHAGPFVREHLKAENGRLLTRSGDRDVAAMLTNHAKLKLQPAEIQALVTQFDAMLKTGGLYQDRCYNCHGPAAVFARTTLKLVDGKMTVHRTNQDVAGFLKGHGTLTSEEQRKVIYDMLRRQLETQ